MLTAKPALARERLRRGDQRADEPFAELQRDMSDLLGHLRVVTEHRPVIGILRAIGYKRRDIILGLLSESAVNATVGRA